MITVVHRAWGFAGRHPLLAALAGVIVTWAVLRLLGGLAAMVGGLVLVVGVVAIVSLAAWRAMRGGALDAPLRLTRGLWGRVSATFQRLSGAVRRYRFQGEQTNHAEVARETETTLGLLALAATDSGEEARVQVWQTQSGLQARLAELARLETVHSGLTHEQAGERASILKGLADLRAAQEPPQTAFDRLWAGDANAAPVRRGFLGGLAGGLPLMQWVAIAGVTVGLGGMAAATVTGVRLNHAKSDLATLRGDLAQAMQERDQWKDDFEAANRAAIQAAEDAAISAQTIAAERARAARAARREQERQREIQNVLTGSGEPPAWRLRDDEPIPVESGADPNSGGDSG